MGLDSECDVTIDVALPANRDAAPAITRLRESLIAEHLGVDTADVTREFARTGSFIATIQVFQGEGRTLGSSEERSVGKEGGSNGRSGGQRSSQKKKHRHTVTKIK